MGKQQWGLFLQDSWKVTRKLSIDYGVRWTTATAPIANSMAVPAISVLNSQIQPLAAALARRSSKLPATARSSAIGLLRDRSTPGIRLPRSRFQNSCPRRLGTGIRLRPRTLTKIRPTCSPSAPSGTNNYFLASSATVLPQPVWPKFQPRPQPSWEASYISNTLSGSLAGGAQARRRASECRQPAVGPSLTRLGRQPSPL